MSGVTMEYAVGLQGGPAGRTETGWRIYAERAAALGQSYRLSARNQTGTSAGDEGTYRLYHGHSRRRDREIGFADVRTAKQGQERPQPGL